MPISQIDQYVISKVKERRKELKMTQLDLTIALNKSSGYISNIEAGVAGKHFNISMLNELAKALNCSPKDFLPEQPF